MLELLETDVDNAHVLLVRHMPPLVLTPEGRSYRLTGGFNLSLFLDGALGEAAGDGQAQALHGSMIGAVGGTGYATKHRPAVWVRIEAVIG